MHRGCSFAVMTPCATASVFEEQMHPIRLGLYMHLEANAIVITVVWATL